MAGQTFAIQRFDDGTIFRILKAAECAGNTVLERVQAESGDLGGTDHKISASFSSGLPWQVSDPDLENAPAGQFILQTASVGFSLQSRQNNQTKNESVTFTVRRGNNDSLNDTFSITLSSQLSGMNSDGAQTILQAIHKELAQFLRPIVPEDGGLIPTLSNLAEGFSTTYQRITEELSAAVANVSAERTKQLNEFNEERERLRAELAQERKTILDTAQEEINAERADIDKLRTQLEEERAQL